MQSWSALFERAAEYDVDETAVRETLDAVRASAERDGDGSESTAPTGSGDGSDSTGWAGDEANTAGGADAAGAETSSPAESSPARVVADADVLAADLFCDGDARRALDHLRRHSWTTLVASGPLVDDAETAVAELADADLASAWRERVSQWCEFVAHPSGDHPALATAYRGGAMHLLSYDERLLSAKAGATLGSRLSVSARRPGAFATLFDPESLYREVTDGEYPGPDRDPRE
ncbi:PIN domain-containing protein [Halobellus limi]|uniref:PIN domain-containing protein n=1 Tax=Halobellus limi TaxID=699433 RepID=A0A1H6CPF6_9EURY|nr:PIN domain-containing protein [Halobellus limi]SEG74870.1 hypothetical protein SAMN04488133_3639 [Halobellus limi]